MEKCVNDLNCEQEVKMKIYKFEIQSLAKVEIEANNEDEAREILLDDLNYTNKYDDIIKEDCYVSDGIEK